MAGHLGVSQQTVSRWAVTGLVTNGAAQRLLDQLEADLAAGRIAPDPAAHHPPGAASLATPELCPASPASLPLPSTAAQAAGFCSAHGGD